VKARRRPVVDRVDRGGEAVVLIGREVVRLSALATALLDACPDWAETVDLAEQLVAQFGPVPEGLDARVATESALRTLHGQGLVELA
jgi:hypothetical protein